MKIKLILLFFLIGQSLMAAKHTVGPVKLDLSDDFQIQASDRILLGFVGMGKDGPQAHFNIQLADLAKLRSGEITVPNGFSDIEKGLRKKKKSSKMSPKNHPTEDISGRTSMGGKEAFVYAVIFHGSTHDVYFSVVDSRGENEARKLYEQIFAQIDECAI